MSENITLPSLSVLQARMGFLGGYLERVIEVCRLTTSTSLQHPPPLPIATTGIRHNLLPYLDRTTDNGGLGLRNTEEGTHLITPVGAIEIFSKGLDPHSKAFKLIEARLDLKPVLQDPHSRPLVFQVGRDPDNEIFLPLAESLLEATPRVDGFEIPPTSPLHSLVERKLFPKTSPFPPPPAPAEEPRLTDAEMKALIGY